MRHHNTSQARYFFTGVAIGAAVLLVVWVLI